MPKLSIKSVQIKNLSIPQSMINFYESLGLKTKLKNNILTIYSTKNTKFVRVKPNVHIEIKDPGILYKLQGKEGIDIENCLQKTHKENGNISVSKNKIQNISALSNTKNQDSSDFPLKNTESVSLTTEKHLSSLNMDSHVNSTNSKDLLGSNVFHKRNKDLDGKQTETLDFSLADNFSSDNQNALSSKPYITRKHIKDPFGNKITLLFLHPRKKVIAVLTSGGDAPGMNTTIRSIVTSSKNTLVYGILNGYDGLINDNMVILTSDSVSYHSTLGGTSLRSARSTDFLTKEGRRRAVYNLVKRNISGLIVIGGDGSMKGLSYLFKEFNEHVQVLYKEGKILNEKLDVVQEKQYSLGNISDSSKKCTIFNDSLKNSNTLPNIDKKNECAEKDSLGFSNTKNSRCSPISVSKSQFKLKEDLKPFQLPQINFVAIPASIDNDIAYCDTTIGSNTCLHRIVDCIDSLASTMASHDRSFIIETMGRHCGWIALFSHFAVGAEYVFLPEKKQVTWERELIDSILYAKSKGKKGCFIVVAEGALEQLNTTCEEIKTIVEKKAHSECRILKLGHIQRGGNPSAYDRILSTLLGVTALKSVSGIMNQPMMATLYQGEFKTIDLDLVIQANDEIEMLQKQKNSEGVMDKRGVLFRRVYLLSEQLRNSSYKKLNYNKEKMRSIPDSTNQIISSSQNLSTNTPNLNEEKMTPTIYHSVDSTKNKIVDNFTSASSDSTEINKKFLHIQHTDIKNDNLYIMQVGQRAGGINFALHVLVRYASAFYNKVIVIENGFDGLINKNFDYPHPYKFVNEVYSNMSLVTSGYNTYDPKVILQALIKQNITSLIIIGDSNGLETVAKLQKLMKKTNNFFTNILIIPVCIENSLPNTDECLGTDSALNFITEGCDSLRNSSLFLDLTIFVAEISGCKTGYLSLFGGISCNAFEVFMPERECTIKHLSDTVNRIKKRFKRSNKKTNNQISQMQKPYNPHNQISESTNALTCNLRKSSENNNHTDVSETIHEEESLISKYDKKKRNGILLIKDANTFQNTNIDAFCKLLTTDSKKQSYDTKYCVFGDLVHGGKTSPIDRIYASVLAIKAVDILVNFKNEQKMDYVTGMLVKKGDTLKLVDAEKCYEDFVKMKTGEMKPDWMKYSDICRKMG